MTTQTRRTSLYTMTYPTTSPEVGAVLDNLMNIAAVQGHIIQDSRAADRAAVLGIRFANDDAARAGFARITEGRAFYGYTISTGLGVHRREVPVA